MDEKQTWRTIRKELEEVGISVAAFDANKGFILEWFKDGISTGAYEEQTLENGSSSVPCHDDSHQSLEHLDTTASEYVPQEVLPPRSKDTDSLDPSQTGLQSNWTTVIPQHPMVTDFGERPTKGSEVALHPDIASEPVIEDAQATHLLLGSREWFRYLCSQLQSQHGIAVGCH
jgi:hypothetical protein